MNSFVKKNTVRSLIVFAASVFFISTVVFSPLSDTVGIPVKKANAQLAVPILDTTLPHLTHSFGDNAKEGFLGIGLDTLAWQIAKQMIQQITSSLVNWINSGFNGSPAFISDPMGFFSDIADQTLGQFLQSSDLGFLCSPIRLEITQAIVLSNTSNRMERSSCTLSGIMDNIKNLDNFFQVSFNTSGNNTTGFMDGGWRGWWDMTQSDANPYDAYGNAQATLGMKLMSESSQFETELNWGDGFLSFRDCSGVPPPERGANQSGCPIATPGSVIVGQLNHTLGLGEDSLVTADEVNEIIGALISQLTSQLLGGGGGLFGLSAGGNQNYNGGSYTGALSGDTSGVTANRDLSDAGIDQNIRLINQYIAIKRQTLAKVNASIALQNSVINQCQAAAQDANAQGIIDNTLQPLALSTQDAIDTANDEIATFEDFRARFQTLPAGDPQALQALQNEYLQFLSHINIDYLIQSATYERDYTVPQQLKPIDTAARTRANACRAQNQQTNPANPGNGNTGQCGFGTGDPCGGNGGGR